MAILVGGAVIVCAMLAAFGVMQSHGLRPLEVTAALLAGAITIVTAWLSFFTNAFGAGPTAPPPDRVRGAIGFNAVVFVVLGLATTVVATAYWPVAVLWAGFCLLGGGFVGLLFGVPLHATGGSKSKSPPAGGTAGTTGGASGNAGGTAGNSGAASQNDLLVSAASTLNKVLTGALVVKYMDIYTEFQKLAQQLTASLQCCGPGNSSFAGGLLLYFSTLGFVSGVLLPRFFFQPGWFGNGPPPAKPAGEGADAGAAANPVNIPTGL